jgi:hypothetical protein
VHEDISTLMSQLARVQQVASSWLSVPPPELPSGSLVEGMQIMRLSFTDQVCCQLKQFLYVRQLHLCACMAGCSRVRCNQDWLDSLH